MFVGAAAKFRAMFDAPHPQPLIVPHIFFGFEVLTLVRRLVRGVKVAHSLARRVVAGSLVVHASLTAPVSLSHRTERLSARRYDERNTNFYRPGELVSPDGKVGLVTQLAVSLSLRSGKLTGGVLAAGGLLWSS